MRRSIIIILSFLLPELIIAQEVKDFTLKEAQEFAAENSYGMRIAEADVAIAGKTVAATRAIAFPKIYGSVDFSNFLDIATTLLSAQAFNPLAPEDEMAAVQFGTEFNTSTGITANQLLFDGSYIVGLQASRAFQGLAKLQKDKVEVNLKESIVQAYYMALVAEENRRILTETLKKGQQLLVETKAMYQSGFMEEQHVHQVQLNVTNMENRLAEAGRQVTNTYLMLKLQMGMELKQGMRLTDKLEEIIKALDYTALTAGQFNTESNIDFQIANTNEQLQRLSLRNERMSFLPSAAAFFSHTQNHYSNKFDVFTAGMTWYPTTLWGIKITVPITDFGMTMANTQKAKLELEKAIIRKQQMDQNLLLQAELARNDFITAWNTYKNTKSNLQLSETIRYKTQVKYKEGVATSLELSQAENQHLATQGNYIQSLFLLLNAKSRLDKILNNY